MSLLEQTLFYGLFKTNQVLKWNLKQTGARWCDQFTAICNKLDSISDLDLSLINLNAFRDKCIGHQTKCWLTNLQTPSYAPVECLRQILIQNCILRNPLVNL